MLLLLSLTNGILKKIDIALISLGKFDKDLKKKL